MSTLNTKLNDRSAGALWGAFIADALAMPVHWYYDRQALQRDYGHVTAFVAPRNPHPDSILRRSSYEAVNDRGDILHDQAEYWGKRGIHYHQFLRAGENTLNLQLAEVLIESIIEKDGYEREDYLQRYVDFMLTPGRHRDTYIEECHRQFFTAFARGRDWQDCAAEDIHIGGLAHVPVLCAHHANDGIAPNEAVRQHVRLTHRSPKVLAAAQALVSMLDDVFRGHDVREAILRHGSDWISERKVHQWSREPDNVVIGDRLSPACYITDAFPASLYLAWKYASDFSAGVIANANAGGDNCHRGAVIGALLGANVGRTKLPPDLCSGLVAAPALLSRASPDQPVG